MHSTHSNYVKPKSDEVKAFGIRHFAGTVHYEVKGFLDKNRDTFSADLKQLITISSNAFLKSIFPEELLATGIDGKKRSPTLSSEFRSSLEFLMRTLESCNPFFVRCVKPNEEQKAAVRNAKKIFLVFFLKIFCRNFFFLQNVLAQIYYFLPKHLWLKFLLFFLKLFGLNFFFFPKTFLLKFLHFFPKGFGSNFFSSFQNILTLFVSTQKFSAKISSFLSKTFWLKLLLFFPKRFGSNLLFSSENFLTQISSFLPKTFWLKLFFFFPTL